MNNHDIGHLTISRKIGEVIEIGDDITIKIKGSTRGYVTLHITAPKDMTITKERSFNVVDIREA